MPNVPAPSGASPSPYAGTFAASTPGSGKPRKPHISPELRQALADAVADEHVEVVVLDPKGLDWSDFEASEAARTLSAAHFPFLGGACLTAEPLDDLLDSALSAHRADELDERTTSEVIRDTLTDSDNAAVVRSWLAEVGLIGGAS